MHHAWILAGRMGIGKASFALQAARELVAEAGAGQMPATHPDIIVLTNLPATTEDEKKRDEGKPFQVKRNISVEQIRTMQQRLTTRPTLGARRAIIIDAADDLEKAAANALLKSLEEPPAGTFFLLVSHVPGRLLPTIRSRCRLLVFPELSASQMDTLLLEHAPETDETTRGAAIAAAAGSVGRALEFVELDLGAMYKVMEQIAHQGDPRFVLRGRLSEAMGARPSRARQAAVLDLARAVVTARLPTVEPADIPSITQAHAELVRLAAQAPTYNFDPGLLIMEIGTLLAGMAASRETADG
jgi:DNA polymerase-3 subunit delta'